MTTTNKVAYYVMLVIVSALFLFAAYPKLIADPMAVEGFAAAHLPVWFLYLVGALEVLGVIGLWIPKTQKWAAWGLMVIMVGAIVVNAITQPINMIIMPIVVGIALWYIAHLGKKRGMSAPTV